MTEQTAVYYGQVKLIPNVVCDGYVLQDGTAMMGIAGTANLLSMHHKSLQSNAANGLPKQLKSFIDIDFNNAVKPILVAVPNSIFNGRVIEALVVSHVAYQQRANYLTT